MIQKETIENYVVIIIPMVLEFSDDVLNLH